MIRMRYLILSLLLSTAIQFSLAQDSVRDALNEFQEYTADSVVTSLSAPSVPKHASESNNIIWILSVLLFTALAGVFIRFRPTRQLRSLFLLIAIVVFGFYRGACPCSIQSFQHAVLLITGINVKWQSVLLFAGLIPLTYLFGRVYCGWICHLGALQEFIFTTSTFKLFQGEAAQKTMRIIRMIALVALVSQLLITGTNLYKQIDPFATIYNFYSANYLGWVLLGVVLLSSVVMYRPFCKTICPVGLILGWINKIPGASVLGVKQNCIACVKCGNACKINAITHDTRTSILDNQECIRCGECLNHCPKDSLFFSRNSSRHPPKAVCKPTTVLSAHE